MKIMNWTTYVEQIDFEINDLLKMFISDIFSPSIN